MVTGPIRDGTGPQALVDLLASEWQVSRPERTDLPPAVIDPDTGTTVSAPDYETTRGVIITEDRQTLDRNKAIHDLVHAYHPEATPPQYEDRGFNEVGTTETVQLDIECADRNIDGVRTSARERMVGDRRDPTNQEYTGLWGEATYILEGVRRRYEEWDVVRQDPVAIVLENSNARVSLNVELERIARNTRV